MTTTVQDEAETSNPLRRADADNTAGAYKSTKRACDCCRKRKVKCDSSNPCGPCVKASIQCAYLQAPKKKGPKGLRSARVLHELRRIDEDASHYPSFTTHGGHRVFNGDWGWHQQSAYTPDPRYGPQFQQTQESPHLLNHNGPPAAPYPSSHVAQPLQQANDHQAMYPPHASPRTWSSPKQESLSEESDNTLFALPISSEPRPARLPGGGFYRYMKKFFEQMFVIMPVINPDIYGNYAFYEDSNSWTTEQYCFMCAICAAVIVQLQDKDENVNAQPSTKTKDHIFAEECLRERQNFDYLDSRDTLSVMTSFFLFAYYGNNENHRKAWLYLQETIAFAENLDMDHEETYEKLEPNEAEWMRRLYWLLFITERAYAIQRRKHARLPKNITQPTFMDKELPGSLSGFNRLGMLFASIDDNFVRAWRGSRKSSLCNEAWLMQTQAQLDTVANALSGINETQELDISITREWLHVLAWQIAVTNGLVWDGDGSLHYPIELAKKVVSLTSRAKPLSLDSHGIGMEQKLSDIAGCLADVLRCTHGGCSATWNEGKHYLTLLTQQLQSIRGGQSRYLTPLLSKMKSFMDTSFVPVYSPGLSARHDSTVPLKATFNYSGDYNPGLGAGAGLVFNCADLSGPGMTFDYGQDAVFGTGHAFDGANGRLTPRLSVADSLGMLRTLSTKGQLGMPALNHAYAHAIESVHEGSRRRPSGFVEEPDHTEHDDYEGMDWHYWNIQGGLHQAHV